jgi:hypothetical protein
VLMRRFESMKSPMQSGIRGIWTETPRFETGDTR